MLALLLVSLLPFDVVLPESPSGDTHGLRLEARIAGGTLRAQLVNGGHDPVKLFVGLTCGGPYPFQLVVDGNVRPFHSWGCSEPSPLIVQLAPGARYDVPKEPLSLKGAHSLVMRYRPDGDNGFWCDDCWSGELASAPVASGRTSRIIAP
jgi:hypothetical protein